MSSTPADEQPPTFKPRPTVSGEDMNALEGLITKYQLGGVLGALSTTCMARGALCASSDKLMSKKWAAAGSRIASLTDGIQRVDL